jgi:hypothetical protein
MKLVRVPKNHGLRRLFVRALSDAFFIPDEGDKKRLLRSMNKTDNDWKYLVTTRNKWVWARVRRWIAPPGHLAKDVSNILLQYGPLLDASTQLPLIGLGLIKQCKGILEVILAGLASDPPGQSFYFENGWDNKLNLQIWRCTRGTNTTEGGIHRPLNAVWGSFNTGIETAVSLMDEWRTQHNVKQGYEHTQLHRWIWHCDLWTHNRIHSLCTELGRYAQMPDHLTEWINGDLFEQTESEYGILSFPAALRDELNMKPYDVDEPCCSGNLAFLARRLNLLYPLLPIVTDEEQALFRAEVLGQNINVRTLVRQWNSKANGKTIYYKTEEELSAHMMKYRTIYFNDKMTARTHIIAINETNLSSRSTLVPAGLIPQQTLPTASEGLSIQELDSIVHNPDEIHQTDVIRDEARGERAFVDTSVERVMYRECKHCLAEGITDENITRKCKGSGGRVWHDCGKKRKSIYIEERQRKKRRVRCLECNSLDCTCTKQTDD